MALGITHDPTRDFIYDSMQQALLIRRSDWASNQQHYMAKAKRQFVDRGAIGMEIGKVSTGSEDPDKASVTTLWAVKHYGIENLHFVAFAGRDECADYAATFSMEEVLQNDFPIELAERYVDEDEDDFVNGHPKIFTRKILDFIAGCIGATRDELLEIWDQLGGELSEELGVPIDQG